MNKTLRFVSALFGILLISGLCESRQRVSGPILDYPAQAINATPTFDVQELDRFSVQSVYSDGTPSSHTVYDGRKSTATITVVTGGLSSLSSAVARSSITVLNNALTTGVVLTVNGQVFTEGHEWSKGAASFNTAVSIASAIDANPGLLASQSGSQAVVYSSATAAGTFANSWTASSSNSAAIWVESPFTGGQDAATVTINGTSLTAGVEWSVGASSQATATNVAAAINTAFSGVIVSTAHAPNAISAGIVFATSSVVGLNAYSLATSSYAALTPSSMFFQNGLEPDISVTDDSFAKSNHGLTTGLKVLVATPTAPGTIPTGLVGGTTYYAIRSSDSLYKLATSSTLAVAGTAVDVTALIGNSTLSVAPLSLSIGSAGFKCQASNDLSDWSDLGISSVTYSAAGNSIWDFGANNYRYLRINFVAPTAGGISLDLNMNGKKDDR